MTTTNLTLTAALAGIALLAFGGPVQGQSPKHHQFRDEQRPAAIAPAAPQLMACAKCTDRIGARPVTDPRGLGAKALQARGKPVQLLPKHQCAGCGNEWVVTGHGKAKKAVAVHKCAGCGAENLACCRTNKHDKAATKGMKKEFKVAPLK